jgi:predicted nuclease of predicted toxin-antitoxin system
MMADIRFLVDMNISPQTVDALRQRGWDIARVSQFLPMTASDQEILGFARQEDRVVVTQDLDFSALVALGGYGRPSLMTLRLSVSDPETITRRLLEALPQAEQRLLEGSAVTVEDTTVRVRRLPIVLS